MNEEGLDDEIIGCSKVMLQLIESSDVLIVGGNGCQVERGWVRPQGEEFTQQGGNENWQSNFF